MGSRIRKSLMSKIMHRMKRKIMQTSKVVLFHLLQSKVQVQVRRSTLIGWTKEDMISDDIEFDG
jgi:hypothetical protein